MFHNYPKVSAGGANVSPARKGLAMVGSSGRVTLNKDRYPSNSFKKRVVLEVVIDLDPVPGWGHEPQDHIDLLCRTNPYIQFIRVLKEPNNE